MTAAFDCSVLSASIASAYERPVPAPFLAAGAAVDAAIPAVGSGGAEADEDIWCFWDAMCVDERSGMRPAGEALTELSCSRRGRARQLLIKSDRDAGSMRRPDGCEHARRFPRREEMTQDSVLI